MEENKNLTPENEDENTPVTEETPEEVIEATEEATEETAEEAIEEAIEEVSEEVIEEAEETVDFAVVAPEVAPEEDSEVAPAKKGNKAVGIIIGVVAAAIAAIIILFAFMLPKSTEGTGNLAAQGMATIKGNSVYHVNFADYRMYKTDIKTGESAIVNETEYVQYIANYKNDIYYLGLSYDLENQSTIYNFKKYVDGVNDVILFSDAITTPQISDGYIYYLKSVPEFYSGYCSRIYRAALKEGSAPELVCDVLCNSFYVDGKDLYYGDVETTVFTKTTIDAAMKAISEAPLAEGATRSSAELGAQAVISTVVANPTVYKNKIYYIDCLNQYELCSYDMKSGEILPFGNGVYATAFNIYGDNIFYHNQSDYCVYRMKLDGSDVIKVSAPGYGFTAISNDKFMTMEISEEGFQYISVCDLDGNLIRNITFEEQYEEFYGEYLEEAADSEEATEEATEEVATEEVTPEETTEEDPGAIETTYDFED